MTWNDDIDELEYELDRDDDPCDHDDYEVDILDGRCWCDRCGHRWHATEDQVAAQIEHQRAYDEWEHREIRRQWWRNLWDRVKSVYPQRRGAALVTDDDIPF